jgi:hypothetical protein
LAKASQAQPLPGLVFYIEGSTVRIITSVAQSTCTNCFQPFVYTAQNASLTSYIEHWTTTSSLTSGWVNKGTLWSAGYEGPALIRLDNGSWRIYVDQYPSGGIRTATSSDLNTWTGLRSVGCSGKPDA